MSKTIEEILAPKPVARLRIYAYSYAYSIDDPASGGGIRPPLWGWWFLFVRVPNSQGVALG